MCACSGSDRAHAERLRAIASPASRDARGRPLRTRVVRRLLALLWARDRSGFARVALKKSDIYRSLWQSCDELRGGMDASQYKDYILTLLFMKYVTDKAKSDLRSLIDVPPGGSFDDMIALKGAAEIGEGMNKIIGVLAKANDLQKVIDLADFNDEEKLGRGREMQDRLSKLVAIFADLDFRGSRAEGDDLLGDAYEYLMRHFATESGKSKGQFYTPAEVSRVMAKIVGIGPGTSQDETVYDPTCGSGSLLLKAADEAPRGITIYGQEKDNATWALSLMNMILHEYADAEILKGDTIANPRHLANNGAELRTFDFAVANPPFSVKSWSNGLEKNEFGRFEYGRPPEKNGDYAFLLHILKSLKSKGKAAVILPHGVLFRGNSEAEIRRQLLDRGFIKGIIGLPPNLFYGTGIPASIVVLDKENAQARTGVFMVDASRGFVKDGPKNRLRSQDIHKIVDVFNKLTEVERYSRMVPLAEIASEANDYNLNIPRYIDSSEPEDIQDLRAHLHGGIPDSDVDALGEYWEAFPSLHATLFKPNRPGYSDLAIDMSEVQQAVLDSVEFKRFSAEVAERVEEWFAAHRRALESISGDTGLNGLIVTLGDDLLGRFRDWPLLDEYDVYEQLLGYWNETMHDDVYLVMNEGWVQAAMPRAAIQDKGRKLSETPDLVIGSGRKARKIKTDLIPPALIVARYFPDERAELDELDLAAEEAARAVEEYIEEHAVEEGLLWGALDEGKLTRALASIRWMEAKREDVDSREIAALEQAIVLFDAESDAKRAAKEAQVALDIATLEKYGNLSAVDVRALVLDDKWKATVSGCVENVLASLALDLVVRINELGGRYGETVGNLEAESRELGDRVAGHLVEIGIQ
jgi:type I restriction enzyme M protein